MIEGVKPYPAYKDSGAPWLGDMPEHWEGRKLRHVLKRATERNRPELPLLSVVRERGVIRRDTTSKDENRNFIPDDLSNYRVVRVGQFAMNKMKAWQGSYGMSHYDGVVSPAYFVFDVSGVDGEFFHAAIRSRAYVPFFAQASDGVRIGQWDLAETRMREIPFLVPPLAEQAAIVRYLDHADWRTRRYIAAKRKLIALLNEQKQAIIHRAVTRGLDPNVRLKPSGVEWLGDVPEHWELVRLKSVLAAPITDGPHVTPTFLPEGVPFLSVDGIQDGDLVFDNCRFISPEDHLTYRTKTAPRRDDLLLTKAASIGKIARVKVDFEFSVWSPLALIRIDPVRATPSFVEYALKDVAAQAQIEALCTLSTQKNISMDDIPRVRLPLPPLPDQEQIAGFTDEALASLDELMNLALRQIDLVREYRTRLISDVVTGKLDVCEAAARLPDEVEEPEPPDGVDALAEGDEPKDELNLDAVAGEAEA